MFLSSGSMIIHLLYNFCHWLAGLKSTSLSVWWNIVIIWPLINSAFCLYISWGLLCFSPLFADNYGSMLPPLNKKKRRVFLSQLWLFFLRIAWYKLTYKVQFWEGKNWYFLRIESLHLACSCMLSSQNCEIKKKHAIVTIFSIFWVYISQFWFYNSQPWVYIPQFSLYNLQLWVYLTIHFLFYSVLETGFYRQETVANGSCFNSLSAVSGCCQNNVTLF